MCDAFWDFSDNTSPILPLYGASILCKFHAKQECASHTIHRDTERHTHTQNMQHIPYNCMPKVKESNQQCLHEWACGVCALRIGNGDTKTSMMQCFIYHHLCTYRGTLTSIFCVFSHHMTVILDNLHIFHLTAFREVPDRSNETWPCEYKSSKSDGKGNCRCWKDFPPAPSPWKASSRRETHHWVCREIDSSDSSK